MDDLISRQAAIDALNDEYHGMISDESMKIYQIINWLDNLPSAEPQKRKTGRWIRDEFGSRCGSCGLYAYRDKFDRPWESPYCPNCGARMEERE